MARISSGDFCWALRMSATVMGNALPKGSCHSGRVWAKSRICQRVRWPYGEDFIEKGVLGFGEKIAREVELFEGDLVVVRLGDVMRPGRFCSGGLGLFVDEVQDLAEDGPWGMAT